MMAKGHKIYNRTSVDILNLKYLKTYCLENNLTLKEFINNAIIEKLDRNEKQKQTHLS